MRKRHINEHMRTSLAGGRAAGTGMLYDRYDDESGLPAYGKGSVHVMLPSDYLTKAQQKALSGPVIIKRIEDL